ncbi:MAG: hypothetical protein IKA80_10715 [Spirochaetaceae bacterium]|nr:hypothetical protein [Spirochaetaceae bacterium]
MRRVKNSMGMAALAAGIYLLVVLGMSCSKMTLQPPVGASAGRLDIVVENFTPDLLRTIAPVPLTEGDLADTSRYTLKLTGTTGRRTLPERTVTLAAGRATLGDMPDGTWSLTLTVYDGTGTIALMSGHTTVTVRGPGAEARFVLTPVTSGTGTVRLTVNWQAADRDFVQPSATPYPSGLTVSMALYDPVTGQKATSYERLSSGGNGAQSDTDAFFRRGFIGTGSGGSTTPLDTTFTYTGGTSGVKTYNVPAGMYMLKFTITGGNLPAGQRLEWSDNLYVETGRETTGTINIPQLTHKPLAPTTRPPQKGVAVGGQVDVTFNWEGVYNASQYEVEVIEYTNGTHPATDQAWATLAQSGTLRQYTATPGDGNNYGNGSNHELGNLPLSGGLLSGQHSIVLRLHGNGRRYAVRVRAVNILGNSPWGYFAAVDFPVTPPAAPSNFTFTTSRYNPDTESFAAVFTWVDVANNDGYELQLLQFSSGTTPRSDADWIARGGTETASTTTTVWRGGEMYGASGTPAAYRSGGLGGNSTNLALDIGRLPGTVYHAVRIRAYNAGGASAWVYPPAPTLLMPVSYISSHNAGAVYTTQVRVFDVDLMIMDIAGSTCTYQFEFIYLASGSLTSVLTQPTDVDMDREWNRLYSLSANNTTVGRGGRRQVNTLSPKIAQLNAGVHFPFRIRTVTMNGGAVVDSTPWSYYYPAAFQP